MNYCFNGRLARITTVSGPTRVLLDGCCAPKATGSNISGAPGRFRSGRRTEERMRQILGGVIVGVLVSSPE